MPVGQVILFVTLYYNLYIFTLGVKIFIFELLSQIIKILSTSTLHYFAVESV
jgi:hypothetical protein